MGKVLDFTTGQEPSIEVKHTEEYLLLVNNLSDFIRGLPLSQADNDRLIQLMLEQTQQAEKDSFMQGFKMGIQFMKQ